MKSLLFDDIPEPQSLLDQQVQPKQKPELSLMSEMWDDFETKKKQIIYIMDKTHGNFVIDLNDTV